MTPRSYSQTYCAIIRQPIGINQHFWLGFQAVLYVNHTLVLKTRIHREEVFVSFFVETSILFIIPKISQLLLDSFTLITAVNERSRNLVLLVNKRFSFITVRILHPLVRILYLGSMIIILSRFISSWRRVLV